MFALKPRIETALHVLLIAVIMFHALTPITASASSPGENQRKAVTASTNNELAFGMTIGSSDSHVQEEVPVLSEQIAKQAQQVEEVKPIRFQVWPEPAIYTPGTTISLHWKMENLRLEDTANAKLIIRAPAGLTPTDPNAIYTQDGAVSIPLSSRQEVSEWSVADGTEFPIYFTLELLISDRLATYQSVMIDQANFSINESMGGIINAMNGRVEVEIPASALDESLSVDIREPAPHTLPAVSLTGQPVEIIAVGNDSKENVEQFKEPIKIKMKYDEKELFDWDENALTLYYHDPDLRDWFPIETEVDTRNNTLTAYSDHLTVFDYKANNWQSQSLPTVDSFKVSDFTGAGTYAINFWMPPGPNGLQPSLALTYNSQVIDESAAFSQPSWVGSGWSLDTGAITRNMHGTDSDTSDDTFSISAGGVSGLLLPVSVNATITTYNTADQSFMKVLFDSANNKWTAYGKDGTTYIFNTPAKTNSTSGCSSTLDLTWKWALTSITDTHNQILSYSYVPETKPGCSNQIAIYPVTITYPNSKYRVNFVLGPSARVDYQTSWASAGSRTLYGTKWLKEVHIQHNAGGWTTVRRYELSYATSTTPNRVYPNFIWSQGGKTLTLMGVQEFDKDDQPLPAVTFAYDDWEHLTDVDNGQGGEVHMDYDNWDYLNDDNDSVRSLHTVFGTDECVSTNDTQWSWVSGGPAHCYHDAIDKYLRVGNQVAGGSPTSALARRSIPESLAKPGGTYQLAMDGISFVGLVESLRWGFREWATGVEGSVLSTNLASPFNVNNSTTVPVFVNPADTYLFLDCSDCKLQNYYLRLYNKNARVLSRTVTVQPGNVVSTYTYQYDNGSPNTIDNSAAVASGGTLYTKKLSEYRGNAMSQVVNPEGLATVNWFYQTDALKGRAYDTLVMHQTPDSYDDFFNSINSNKWVTAGGVHTSEIPSNSFDNAAKSFNPSADWNVSLTRSSASLTSGEMAVAHVRLSGANAEGDVGLVKSGQFFGITFDSNTATASNGTTLLSAGNFIKDEWYGVMFFLDSANGSRMRIWQLDNPDNFGETVINNIGSGSWKFRDQVYNGTIWLDSYFEGIPYSETITRYNTTVHYNVATVNNLIPSATVFQDLQVVWNNVASVEQRNYNGDAKHVGTKQEFTYDTASNYGNLLTQKAYSGNNGVWTLYRGTKYEYSPNATNYIVSLPSRQVTLDCNGGSCDFSGLTGKEAETYFFYDGSTSYTTPPTKGDLTMQRVWVQGTDYSQTSFTYSTNGNLESQTLYTGYATSTADPATGITQTTTTTYDTDGYNTYPRFVENELEHVIETTYNYALGVPISLKDPNNAITSATYDGFGRLETITAPGDGSPTLQVTYFDTQIPFQIDLVQAVNATASIQLSRFYDGAGRQIQTQTEGAVVNGVQKNVVVDYLYDTAGRLEKQSIPNVRTYDSTPGFVTQDFTPSTETDYDILGRILSVTPPNGNEVSYDYADLSTTVTDPKLVSTTTTMDVWGRTTLVDAPTGPDVSYTYDILNRLTEATRGGETTTIDYDAAGRKLEMDDPDMGVWQYQYDALGNLKRQKDARGQRICLYYDALNRLTGKHYRTNDSCPTSPTFDVSYGYDDTLNNNKGKGRRTSMNDDSGLTTWKYDERGRILNEVKTIDGAPSSFTTSWTYNSADLPITMTYPVDNEVLTYGYNSDGSLNTVTSSLGSTTYLAGTKYDEAGRILSMDYGASILRKTFNYFPWNTAIHGGLLEEAITTRVSGSVTLQSFEYTYDKNANVETILDTLAGPQTQTFDYDSLNRLTSAVATGGLNGLYNESYTYNATTGNLATKAGVNYTYDPNHPHAVASLSNGNTYQYDLNGNMIERNVAAMTYDLVYDAENRLTSVSGTGTLPPTATPTPSHTPTSTYTPTATLTNTPGGPTDTPTLTPTPSNTPTTTNTATNTATNTPGSDLIFADGFESADLSAWTSSSTDGGDLSASTAAALKGTYGLQAVIDDTSAIYLTDDNPNAEPRYRARFYFDPNSITMASGDTHFIFKGFSGASTDVFQVEFRYSSGNYELRVRVLNDASAWTATNWFTLSDASHYIELDWRAATASGANDGGLTLWIDGTQQADLTSIDNDTWRVDRARLGALSSLDAGTSGTYYFDAFESRRSNYIGPMAFAPSVHFASYRFNPLQQSGSLSFTPADDAHIQSANPTNNYGSATTLQVDNSPVKHFLLKFDVTGVNGGQVTNAKLCLYNVDGANEGGDFYHVADDSWQEETVTWNNAPAADTTLLGSLGSVSPNNWYEVDLTSHITTDGLYSLRVSDSVGGADYSSKEGSNAPKLLVSVGGATPQSCTGTATTTPTATLGPTNTPTLTPTPGPSPTPTAPFTPTPTQILSIFSNAVFTYDGDGKRVKSVITTNVGTTTTYFVGTYYEVADGVVTKYYYAGAQRIAMRANGTLNYLLGDHLGSTSLTADASGQVVSELRYTAWGEVRHASGNTATKYQYTGQYSYAGEFGLHFYNARWYDSSLGRFAQADMIVPGAGNPQAWDRYAYVLNNPLRYTDPTGHLMTPYDGGGGGSGSYTPPCSIFTNICNGGSSNNNGGGGSGSGGCNSLSCVITGGNQGSGNGGSSSGSSGGGGCTSLACVLNNGNPGGNVFGGGGCNSLGCVVNNGSSESNEAIYSCDDPKLGCVTDVGGTWQDPAVYISIAVGGWASGLFSTAFWGSATACIANPVCRWVTGMAGGVGGAGTQDISILVRQAQQQYPNKAGQIQLHHVFPVYLGGDPNGTRVAIDAAYHQVITNAFRALWPYGQGAPTAEQAQRIMQQVYERFPLP